MFSWSDWSWSWLFQVLRAKAFTFSLARNYVPRQADFAALDAHALGTGPPLVVEGRAGAGKSALVANQCRRPAVAARTFYLHPSRREEVAASRAAGSARAETV